MWVCVRTFLEADIRFTADDIICNMPLTSAAPWNFGTEHNFLTMGMMQASKLSSVRLRLRTFFAFRSSPSFTLASLVRTRDSARRNFSTSSFSNPRVLATPTNVPCAAASASAISSCRAWARSNFFRVASCSTVVTVRSWAVSPYCSVVVWGCDLENNQLDREGGTGGEGRAGRGRGLDDLSLVLCRLALELIGHGFGSNYIPLGCL